MPADHQTPVLVVGAGPTGLLLAAELERRGVPCHLIDARPAPLHWDRTTVMHPRSIEIFESVGLAEKFLEAGCKQRVIRVYSSGKLLGSMDLSTCGSRYGFNLGMSEEVTESILTDYLDQHGGEVRRGSRLVGLTQQAEGAVAEIERNGDRYQVDARWVVGCDGFHSLTREVSGIGFEGHDIAKAWAVFDATVQGWTETYEGNFAYLDEVPVILTALPNHRFRVYLRPGSAESDLVMEAASILNRYLPGASFKDVENPTRFHCHSKVAMKFRSGAVFLAGDAAHVCTPAEGHGMNSGVQDAFNLAWKLALVHHRVADAKILDSYEAERRPVAKMITQSGDGAEAAQAMTDATERASRDDAIRAMLSDPRTRHYEVLAETELNRDYSPSPIVAGDANGTFMAGRFLPNAIPVHRPDGQSGTLHQLAHRAGHTLLLLAGPTADLPAFVTLHADLKKVVSRSDLFEEVFALGDHPDLPCEVGRFESGAAGLLGVQAVTLFVARPDGYIGLRSDLDHRDALEHYRKLVCGAPN
jgi:2-polyprenyl-6-methoxyphenol hydroxylase-like FAD-dependent oxidoreductase